MNLSSPGQVTLTVYDSKGRRVAELLNGYEEAGVREVIWDGRTTNGSRLSSGIYFLRLIHPNGEDTRRVALIE